MTRAVQPTAAQRKFADRCFRRGGPLYTPRARLREEKRDAMWSAQDAGRALAKEQGE